MKHFLFEERLSGEEFIVGADNLDEAELIAEGIAPDIGEEYNGGVNNYYLYFVDELTEEEAEASGLDEY